MYARELEELERGKVMHFALIGDPGVGKSAITLRLVTGKFVEKFDSNLEDSYKAEVLFRGRPSKLDILDTGDLTSLWLIRNFECITANRYGDEMAVLDAVCGTLQPFLNLCDGLMFVFDLSERRTFENVPRLASALLHLTKREFPVLIVGNKTDTFRRSVMSYEGDKLAANFWQYAKAASLGHEFDLRASAPSTSSVPPSGTPLFVTIYKCEGLVPNAAGVIDPYVSVAFHQRDPNRVMTRALQNNVNPEYNESLQIVYNDGYPTMFLTVFNNDLQREEFVAEASLQLHQLKPNEKAWLQLFTAAGLAQGRILMSWSFPMFNSGLDQLGSTVTRPLNDGSVIYVFVDRVEGIIKQGQERTDPYVEVYFDDRGRRSRTISKPDTLNPSFRETLQLMTTNSHTLCVYVRVVNEDRYNERPIAVAQLNLLQTRPNELVWLTLIDARGYQCGKVLLRWTSPSLSEVSVVPSVKSKPCSYIEVSARNGTNISEAFDMLMDLFFTSELERHDMLLSSLRSAGSEGRSVGRASFSSIPNSASGYYNLHGDYANSQRNSPELGTGEDKPANETDEQQEEAAKKKKRKCIIL